ncbi:MAG: hypothetical protein ACHQ53_08140 [Polyangiales bacterium]
MTQLDRNSPKLVAALAVLCAVGAACGDTKPQLPPTPTAPSMPTQPELDRVKLLQEAQAAEKAARKKRRDEMRAMGTATIKSKKQIGKGKDVKLELEFEFKNTSSKEMLAAEGALEIRDGSGELLKSLKLPFPGPIKPGDTVKKTGKFPTDPGKPTDVTLVKSELEALQLNWVPQHYKFADGTDERGE